MLDRTELSDICEVIALNVETVHSRISLFVEINATI